MNITPIGFLQRLKDVLVTAPTDGQVLAYDASDSAWENKAGGGGGGGSQSFYGGPNSQTIATGGALSIVNPSQIQVFVPSDQTAFTISESGVFSLTPGSYIFSANITFIFNGTPATPVEIGLRLLQSNIAQLSGRVPQHEVPVDQSTNTVTVPLSVSFVVSAEDASPSFSLQAFNNDSIETLSLVRNKSTMSLLRVG